MSSKNNPDLFACPLEWDTISIQNAMVKYLTPRGWNPQLSMGFSDSGNSAFIIESEKDRCVIVVEIGNESKDIRIRGGIHGKYLPKGKQIPKFKHTFKSTELKAASEFFENLQISCVDIETPQNEKDNPTGITYF